MNWVWLVDLIGHCHAYPDDETVEKAVCGHQLTHECVCCGQMILVRGIRPTDTKCGACEKKIKVP